MALRALAAAATPLRDDGRRLDEDAFGLLVEFFVAGGLDGILALGTTGEGLLLSVEERRRVAELFVQAPFQVIVHAGAQTTVDTVALAAHAAEVGAAGVAVIGPPYFVLDDEALLAHFTAAAAACDPVPFYVYEFERASGYAFPVELLARLAERAPNLAGLKVSDTPYERFAPYLATGFDVFVGPEAFIARGIDEGAVGAVSALATAFPEAVAAAVRDGGDAAARVGELRTIVERFPRHAALKLELQRRGVAIRDDVRAPLRRLSPQERDEFERLVARWRESPAPAPVG
jgi:dihydrodipicolinate synthase/N-acetylneuraminate lyase